MPQRKRRQKNNNILKYPTEKFNYLLNDITSPIKIMLEELPPQPSKLQIAVKGCNTGDINKPGSPIWQGTNCYITLAKSIQSAQKVISLSRKPLPKWAVVKTLDVFPRAGKKLNAFYNRRALKFFYYPVGKKTVFTSESTDIVAHEFGHALLDTMRPDFWSVQSLEIWSFHEAFSDITAMLAVMNFDEVLQKALKQTKNNLRSSNVISRLAEEVGKAVFGKKHLYLRDAVNNFKYTNPKKLPKEAPDNKLAAECHSFGRIFLGAWYEMMLGIFEKEMKRIDPLSALTIAKNVMTEYLYKAIFQSPRTNRYHEAISKCILAVDRAQGGKYQDILKNTLVKRNLLSRKVKALSNITWNDLSIQKEDEVMKIENAFVVTIRNKRTIRLLDYKPPDALFALSFNGGNLADVEIEIPFDSYYEFDSNGNVIDEMLPDESAIIEEAEICATFITQTQNVSKTVDTMWAVEKGKLVRTFIE